MDFEHARPGDLLFRRDLPRRPFREGIRTVTRVVLIPNNEHICYRQVSSRGFDHGIQSITKDEFVSSGSVIVPNVVALPAGL